jgi:DNA-binding HxlR family transcriptional regulator
MMRGGPVRLGQLSRLLPEASKKVLMTELKQLVSSGLVERRDLSDGGVVRHVEYNLIESIRPAIFLLLEQLERWTLAWESADTNGIKKR